MTERTKTVEAIIAAKMEQRFSVGGLRNEEEELLDELIGADYAIRPLWNHKAALQKTDRGVPFRENLSGFCEADTGIFPPPTNRGVSKRLCEPNTQNPKNPEICFGGYDGGAEVGFEGDWDSAKFTELKAVLQAAKDKASESESCTELVSVNGHEISVDASGARAGLLYRFKFTLGGITFFIHHNPPRGRQAVRVRYGAMALIGRSLFDVHAVVLNRERLSRLCWFDKF